MFRRKPPVSFPTTFTAFAFLEFIESAAPSLSAFHIKRIGERLDRVPLLLLDEVAKTYL
ncbi:MAG: hypothetical protein QW512_03310 [Thermofilaceae archaeon]